MGYLYHMLIVNLSKREINMAYQREKAVQYAHKWAFGRNPAYYNFTGIGGDCTSFVSQCIHAGGAPMNYKKDLGWYYNSVNSRAPAWSGVQFLYNFLTTNKGVGPKGLLIPLRDIEIGDIIQLSFNGTTFGHTLMAVSIGFPVDEKTVLIATHSDDSDYRPLSTYEAAVKYRCLKIRI